MKKILVSDLIGTLIPDSITRKFITLERNKHIIYW